jgi:hypothetical protein
MNAIISTARSFSLLCQEIHPHLSRSDPAYRRSGHLYKFAELRFTSRYISKECWEDTQSPIGLVFPFARRVEKKSARRVYQAIIVGGIGPKLYFDEPNDLYTETQRGNWYTEKPLNQLEQLGNMGGIGRNSNRHPH